MTQQGEHKKIDLATTPSLPETPHLGPVLDEQSNREEFGSHELAIILSRFDLGVIEQIQMLPIGSRRAPKVRIRTRHGEFLLKRRAGGRDEPYRVAYVHEIMLCLAGQGYPVPRLIGTRDDNNSLVQFTGRTYELFEFIDGTRYDRTPPAAREAGRTLARMHNLLGDFTSDFDPPTGGFHGFASINEKLSVVPAMVDAVSPNTDNQTLSRICDFLAHAYAEARTLVDRAGFTQWPRCVQHGDWHPGNLLYQSGRINAVLDFDSARLEPRISDIANAALQFSMQMSTSENATLWPDGLEIPLLAAVVRGYDDEVRNRLSRDELESLPWLIIEALITESVLPISATGSFAHLDGAAFLEMVKRKIQWLAPRAVKLAAYLEARSN